MLDRFLALLFLDAFQSVRTHNPLLNERRQRERRMIVAAAFCLLCVVMSVLIGNPAPLHPVVAKVVAMLDDAILFGLIVAWLWLVLEMIGYWRFWRRVGA